MIECPSTSKCVTSLCCDSVKNQEEDTRAGEECAQKGDADSGEEGKPDWRGTTEKTTSKDEEEASGSHFAEKGSKQTATTEDP
ncbi:hypothetical protein NDU88_002031 [Pleurodeles waltl]|uniref:Uncharacterized protein n=1 Tax=Pleurodeles waltl TaxID=8319 RepID=A0AAV7VA15_PLEWA|nr:hypothetical protein NDU88_002031 [Pleurodeles waltl]